MPYGKGGGFNRSAHSAWPGHGKEVKKEMGKWEMGNGRWDFANIYDQGGKCKVSKKGVGDVYGRVFGGSMSLLGVTWADIWGPLGVAGELWGSWAAWWGFGGAYIAKYSYLRVERSAPQPDHRVE